MEKQQEQLKKIIVIYTSYRRGNSERLGDAFSEGAEAAGHLVEKIYLRDQTIQYCTGCEACKRTGHCVLNDDGEKIARKMVQADVVALVLPVYFGNIPGPLKTLFDRMNAVYRQPYRFRKVVVFATADQNRPEMFDGVWQSVESWLLAFPKAERAESIGVGGVNRRGEIEGHPALRQAEALGHRL
ncbi:flavodoxin family protein [uncultured Pseudoramibacter sp.]|uniref:flavodoxin family protein n=1 Tax=uncultured Pseudoramibacter sp. TaxID=1623493 RepID=UPI0025D5BA31|nr:flavodoxin family protein [uncultured Pseudoramibacter sp.]